MTIWALEWHDTKTQERAVCEVEGGVCYEVGHAEQEMQRRADALNAEAHQRGWSSRYTVIPLPEGLTPHFD